ncbi:MAG: CoA transferase [Dehalococcoidia bacterium]|jgi:crotonobetainyl-CoA:carnitine CoA-transferase CaiB-like acyl-CoA transferase|nr:CoA transferase [Dehalococcoidia bacterium]
MMTGTMPLDDVRIIDLTQTTIGPFCTRMLGDYGADVIKIERPGTGDPARTMPPFFNDEPGIERSGLFLFLNTNKRSVTVDLESERGRQIIRQLVENADVLVENFAPGVMGEMGLGYEALTEVNPRIVVTSLSNYGQSGPYHDFAGTEINLYGMGGNMIASGDIDHEPVKTAGRMVNYHAGYVGALATTMSLHATEFLRDGIGEHLDVSVFETATHSIDSRLGRLMGYQHSGNVGTRPGRSAAVASGVFQCADGWFLITGTATFVHLVIKMIGMDELLEQPEWATVAERAKPERIDEFAAYLVPWMLERTKSEVRDACEAYGILGGPMNTIADLLSDPGFESRGYFQEIDHPTTGAIKYPGFHFTIHRDAEDGGPMPARRRAPLLGEHTDEVLSEGLGLSDDEISRLRAERVI